MFAKLSRDSAELVSSFRLDCTKISFPFLKKIYKIFLFFNITKALTLFLTVYEREYTCLCLCIWSVFQFYLGILILTVRIFNCVYEYLNVWICISVVISVCVCVCVWKVVGVWVTYQKDYLDHRFSTCGTHELVSLYTKLKILIIWSFQNGVLWTFWTLVTVMPTCNENSQR